MRIRKLLPWVLGIALGAVSLTLGYRGFRQHFDSIGVEKTWLDLMYLDWQLFTLESGAVDGPVPIELQIARILSPLLAAWALWAVLAALLKRQLRRIVVSFWRDHIVICGLGRTGLQLAQSCREVGERVVVLERDESCPRISVAEECGAWVLCADATREESLDLVNSDNAKAVIAVAGDDGANVQIAVNAHALSALAYPRHRGRTTRCYVQSMEYVLANLLKEHPVFVGDHDGFDMTVFNVYENAARRLLRLHPLDRLRLTIDDPRNVHLVIVGLGQMGESVLIQTAKTAHFANARKPSITVVDRHAAQRERALRVRYPQIDAVVNLSFVQSEIWDAETVDSLTAIAKNPEQLCSIALCLDQDSVNAQFALHLDRAMAGIDCPLLVRLGDDSGLVRLFDGATEARDIHPFGMASGSSDWRELEQEASDSLARAIHEAYLAKRRASGEPEDASTRPWSKLSPSLRDSNRQQADHIPVKLRALGYGMRADSGDGSAGLEMSEHDIETLARMEHARWNAERALAGWAYGTVKDVERKRSPHMIPYDDLRDAIKDYDRATARNLPALLEVAKQEAYPLRPSAPPSGA